MRKFICMSLTLMMLMTSSLAVGYAATNNDTESKMKNTITETEKKIKDLHEQVKDLHEEAKDLEEEARDLQHELDSLKKDLEKQYKDKDKRKDLIKKISKIRKNNDKFCIPFFVNGKELEFNNGEGKPFIKNGRTLIPVRAVSNYLGAEVHWNATDKTITVTKSVYGNVYDPLTSMKTTIVLKLDSKLIKVNGNNVEIDVPAQLENDRTMVPVRFIAELIKKSVEWDEDTQTITIDDEDDNKIEDKKPGPVPPHAKPVPPHPGPVPPHAGPVPPHPGPVPPHLR